MISEIFHFHKMTVLKYNSLSIVLEIIKIVLLIDFKTKHVLFHFLRNL